MVTASKTPGAKQGVSAPDLPSATPQYASHQDHSFTLQAVMEMQKSIGELKATITDNTSAINSMRAKVDGLVEWKNKILGGAVVLGAVIALAAFLISKFSDYVTISAPVSHHPTVEQPTK